MYLYSFTFKLLSLTHRSPLIPVLHYQPKCTQKAWLSFHNGFSVFPGVLEPRSFKQIHQSKRIHQSPKPKQDPEEGVFSVFEDEGKPCPCASVASLLCRLLGSLGLGLFFFLFFFRSSEYQSACPPQLGAFPKVVLLVTCYRPTHNQLLVPLEYRLMRIKLRGEKEMQTL